MMPAFIHRGSIAAIVVLILLTSAACTNQSGLSATVNADATDAMAVLKPAVEEGRYDEALSSLRSMAANTAEYRFDEDELIDEWSTIYDKENFEVAADWAAILVDFYPRNDSARSALGWSQVHAGNLADAKEQFNRALAINPDNSQAQRGLDHIYIINNYTKKEYRIPMRDGVHLFTAVYSPKDTSVDYPFIMVRTPYSVDPYGEDKFPSSLGPSMHFAHDGFHFVYQDVRGKYMSEGEFRDMRPLELGSGSDYTDEATDTYDTIDWLLANVPHNNGKVGMWGISYPGGYTSMGAVSRHPALVAASPQAPTTNWFIGDDFHRDGAFTLLLATSFYPSFGKPRPEPTTESEWETTLLDVPNMDMYEFLLEHGTPADLDAEFFHGQLRFWNEIIAHPNYDKFWKDRNILPHLTGLKTAMMNVGGLLDAEDPYGPVATYETAEKANPEIQNILVVGPWYHGGWARTGSNVLGDIDFHSSDASKYFQEQIQFPFFRYYLKGGEKPDLPEALIFATGSNEWHRFDKWPAENITPATLYLHANGALGWDSPTTSANNSYDEYLSDPKRPVPLLEKPVKDWNYEFMHADQRFAAKRPDVLVYQTEPLKEEVILAGPIVADLMISSTGTDADFIVKLIDVYPDDYEGTSPRDEELPMGGYQMLVRWKIMPARFRDSFEEPKALIPGEVAQVRFNVDDVLHTFKPGHRIMVQIQSSWFPIFMRNPQTFVENIYKAKPEDFRKATMRVYRSSSRASHLEVGILPK